MALPASDDFNRASIGANWTSYLSGKGIITTGSVGAHAEPVGDQGCGYWNVDTFADDQYSQIEFTATSGITLPVGPAVRAGADKFYAFVCDIGGSWYLLHKLVGSALGVVANGSGLSVASGDIFKLEVSGTSLTVKRNGSTVLGPYTHSGIASGAAGVEGYDHHSTIYANAWEGGNLGGGGGVTGTGAASIPASTAASSGTTVGTGTGSASTEALTATSSGTPVVTGTASALLDVPTAVGSGSPVAAGTAAASLALVTAQSEGYTVVTGVGDASIPAVGPTGSGTPVVTGTVTTEIPAFSVAADGTPAVVGIGAASLAMLTAEAYGAVGDVVTGNGAATVPGLEVQATGVGIITGTATASLPAFEVSSSGTLPVTGTAGATLELPTVQSVGTGVVTGTAVGPTVPSFTASASGTVGDQTVTGTGGASIPALTCGATGTSGNPTGVSIMTLTQMMTTFRDVWADSITIKQRVVSGYSAVRQPQYSYEVFNSLSGLACRVAPLILSRPTDTEEPMTKQHVRTIEHHVLLREAHPEITTDHYVEYNSQLWEVTTAQTDSNGIVTRLRIRRQEA